jgi:hypothetical protein
MSLQNRQILENLLGNMEIFPLPEIQLSSPKIRFSSKAFCFPQWLSAFLNGFLIFLNGVLLSSTAF